MAKRKGMTAEINVNLRYQLHQLARRLEWTEKETNEVLTKTLQSNANMIQNEINSALEKHILTGETIKYAIVPKVEQVSVDWSRFWARVNVGVELSGNLEDMRKGDGGYASLLLDYGTPKKRVQKNPKRQYKHALTEPVQPRVIGSAIRRGRRRWEEEAQKEYERIIKEKLGE